MGAPFAGFSYEMIHPIGSPADKGILQIKNSEIQAKTLLSWLGAHALVPILQV
jgi:hypothetical protein